VHRVIKRAVGVSAITDHFTGTGSGSSRTRDHRGLRLRVAPHPPRFVPRRLRCGLSGSPHEGAASGASVLSPAEPPRQTSVNPAEVSPAGQVRQVSANAAAVSPILHSPQVSANPAAVSPVRHPRSRMPIHLQSHQRQVSTNPSAVSPILDSRQAGANPGAGAPARSPRPGVTFFSVPPSGSAEAGASASPK
jgi:hypothetical protein